MYVQRRELDCHEQEKRMRGGGGKNGIINCNMFNDQFWKNSLTGMYLGHFKPIS